MDTGTHLVMGFALGGLATLDPVIAHQEINTHSVLFATIIGSQIPDIDTALKFKNNAIYIRNHRGITHSIPAVILWPLIIASLIHLFFPSANMFHLWIWTFIAVFLHVFVDIFNAYGTQALRPLSMKWVALGTINTFDPIIFSIHIVGLALWGFGLHPGYTFLTIYVIIIIYYLLRFREQWAVRQAVKRLVPDTKKIIIAPTIRFYKWRVVVETSNHFYVGKAYKRDIQLLDTFKKIPVPQTPEIEAAKKDKNLSAFLSFSPIFRWEVREKNDHSFEVKFIDLRYRSKGHYPFVAIVQLDDELNITGSYTGWIYNNEKLRKKLDVAPR